MQRSFGHRIHRRNAFRRISRSECSSPTIWSNLELVSRPMRDRETVHRASGSQRAGGSAVSDVSGAATPAGRETIDITATPVRIFETLEDEVLGTSGTNGTNGTNVGHDALRNDRDGREGRRIGVIEAPRMVVATSIDEEETLSAFSGNGYASETESSTSSPEYITGRSSSRADRSDRTLTDRADRTDQTDQTDRIDERTWTEQNHREYRNQHDSFYSIASIPPCEDFCVLPGGGLSNEIELLETSDHTFSVHTPDSVGFVFVQNKPTNARTGHSVRAAQATRVSSCIGTRENTGNRGNNENESDRGNGDGDDENDHGSERGGNNVYSELACMEAAALMEMTATELSGVRDARGLNNAILYEDLIARHDESIEYVRRGRGHVHDHGKGNHSGGYNSGRRNGGIEMRCQRPDCGTLVLRKSSSIDTSSISGAIDGAPSTVDSSTELSLPLNMVMARRESRDSFSPSDSSSSVDDQLSVIPALDDNLVSIEFITSDREFRGSTVPLLETKQRLVVPTNRSHSIEPALFNYKALETRLWRIIICTNRVHHNMYSIVDARMRFRFEIIGSFNIGTHSKYGGRYYERHQYRSPFLTQGEERVLFGSSFRQAASEPWREYYHRLRRRFRVVNERTQATLLRSYEWVVSVNGTQVGVLLGPPSADQVLLAIVKDAFERKTRRRSGEVDFIQPDGCAFYFTRHRFILYCSNMDHLPILCSRIEDRASGNLYSFFVYRSPVRDPKLLMPTITNPIQQ